MVLVYAESPNGQLKKAAFEAVAYGHLTAQAMGTSCVALVLGDVADAGQLGLFGASTVYQVQKDHLSNFDSQVYSAVIASAAQKLGAQVVVVSHTSTGKSLLGRLAVKLNAGSVAGAKAVPDTGNGFVVAKGVFSGKATAHYAIQSAVKVLSVMGNSIPLKADGHVASVQALDVAVPSSRIKVLERKTVSGGKAPLPEAELVVSAGRGLKGPENWGIVEDLADALGATTACSRPVADIGWRPHHEHVGQTGVAIRPNLYIAAGISGAIQHLAGVNSSKVIVVINKDPEAPFFKAADYGVVGDAFEVLPRLTEAVNRFKNS
ncbi:MAG: electron transfer flavoprotein subunit alpha/FixB family protein [Bacteroidetes Order II. Incertae sedis bacterium]|nr:electron transfer flavoprotein subunit alpha/FixB family protein [Bacteroidetes Order II. bacterium]